MVGVLCDPLYNKNQLKRETENADKAFSVSLKFHCLEKSTLFYSLFAAH